MNKTALQVARKFAAMFNVGDIVLYGKYKNKKGRLLSFGKNDKGQPTITIEPIPKGRKQNKVIGLYKIWTAPKAESDKAEAQAKAEEEEKKEKAKKEAALDLDPQLQQMADLLVKGLSDRKILQTMGISYNEAHTLAQKLREALGITSMDNLRKTLKMRHADTLSTRVASRFILASGIPVGKSWDSGDVRVHRFRDSFVIWDLTNAGKRGKKVQRMSVSLSYGYKGNREEWFERVAKVLPDFTSYAKVKAFFEDILKDNPHEISLSENDERGIDVNPGGTTKITLTTNTGIEITSEPMEFMLKTHVPLTHPTTGKPNGFQDTTYWSRKKEEAKVFYNWLQANLSQANKMTLQEFKKLWDDSGISWDSH